MFSAILFLHIVLAVVMAGVAAHSLLNVVRGQLEGLPRQAKSLSILLLFEAASGSLLGLLAPQFSVEHFCVNVGLYLAAFLFVQFVIFAALKKNPSLVFPHLYARVSTGMYLAAFALVIFVRVPLF